MGIKILLTVEKEYDTSRQIKEWGIKNEGVEVIKYEAGITTAIKFSRQRKDENFVKRGRLNLETVKLRAWRAMDMRDKKGKIERAKSMTQMLKFLPSSF